MSLACLRTGAVSDRRAPVANDPVNAVTRAWDECITAAFVGDWDEVGDLFVDDIVRRDHRPLGVDAVGRDELVASARAMVEQVSSYRTVWLELRGDALALGRNQMFSDSGFLVETFQVAEVNEAGRLTRVAYFDTEHLDLARAELDQWWSERTEAQ